MGRFADLVDPKISIASAPKTRFSDLLAPEDSAERGFIDNISESWKRGRENVLADIALYDSYIHGIGDKQGAINVRNKLRQKEVLDPVYGNFLADTIYKGTTLMSQWFESAKKGGKWAAILGGGGAAIGAGIGLLNPTIGEEPVTTGVGAAVGLKLGAKLGLAEGTTMFWYKQGAGEMLGTMLDNGISPDIALPVSQFAAIPYALIESLQLATAGKPAVKAFSSKAIREGLLKTANKSLGKVLAKAGKEYGKTYGKEILQELSQEVVQITAEDMAAYLDKKGVKFDKEYFIERAKRLGQVGLYSAQAFLVPTLPGGVVSTTTEVGKWKGAKLAKETMGESELSGYQVQPISSFAAAHVAASAQEISSDPLIQLDRALSESIAAYSIQSEERTKELSTKFERAKIYRESGTGSEALKNIFKAFKGEMAKINIEPFISKINPDAWEALAEEIRISDKLDPIEAANLWKGLESLRKEGKILPPHLIKYARKQFGSDFAMTLETLQEASKGKIKGFNLQDYLNLPRATSTAVDLSRTLRQNVMLLGQPKLWWAGLENDVKTFVIGEKQAKALEKQSALSRWVGVRKRTVLRHNRIDMASTYWQRAEPFASRFANQIPGVKRSQLAYVAGGNFVRDMLFDRYAENWERMGLTPSKKDYNDLAHVINIITGEGDARWLGDHAATANAVFFAPRLVSARVQAVLGAALFVPQAIKGYATGDYTLKNGLGYEARKVLAYHSLTFALANMAILTTMSFVPGVDIEKDPRSTDFGKIRIGDTRLDFWGGYLPIARLVTHLITRKQKSRSGKLVPKKIQDSISTFLQSKLGPAPAFLLDIWKGQTFYGEDVGLDAQSLSEQFWHRFTPFFIQDMIDAMKYQGVGAGLATAPLAFFGAGVQTYPITPGTELSLYKDKIAKEVMGQKWEDVGLLGQELLRRSFPQIEIKQRQIKFERENYRFLERMAEDEANAAKKIFKQLPADIRYELNLTQTKITGLSRRVGSGWYLNDKRYKEYQFLTAKALSAILAKAVRQPKWNTLSPNKKQLILDQLIAMIKSSVRQKIIQKASIEDIKRAKEIIRK